MRCTFGARLAERLAYPFASAVAHCAAVLALRPTAAPIAMEELETATVVIEAIAPEPEPPPEPEPLPDLEPPAPEPAISPPDDLALDPTLDPLETSRELDVSPPELDAPTDLIDPGPVDLTGTMLTAKEGPGAAMKVAGTGGAARKKKKDRASTSRGSSAATESGPPAPPRIVALENLSRPPSPPALDAALARLYPPDARREGRAGSAAVRALVGADGRVRSAAVASASDAAFGQACQQLVMGSAWSPPLDSGGEPVATWVRYTCRFRIDR
jgi:TonB family protein